MRLNGVKLLQNHLIGKILYCLHYDLDEVGYSPTLAASRSQLVLVISHVGFEGGTLVLIASVPGHCLSFTYFSLSLVSPVMFSLFMHLF